MIQGNSPWQFVKYVICQFVMQLRFYIIRAQVIDSGIQGILILLVIDNVTVDLKLIIQDASLAR